MEKVAQDEIKSKLNEIEAALNDGDHALDEKIKTVNLNLESVKNGMTDQIEQVNVSIRSEEGRPVGNVPVYLSMIFKTVIGHNIYLTISERIEWRIYEQTK